MRFSFTRFILHVLPIQASRICDAVLCTKPLVIPLYVLPLAFICTGGACRPIRLYRSKISHGSFVKVQVIFFNKHGLAALIFRMRFFVVLQFDSPMDSSCADTAAVHSVPRPVQLCPHKIFDNIFIKFPYSTFHDQLPHSNNDVYPIFYT
jgi:hypothetical protein